MRALDFKASTDFKASAISVALHALVFLLLFLHLPWFNSEPLDLNSGVDSLQTRTLSEDEFKQIEKLASHQKTEQVVQSEDLHSSPDMHAPLTQKIYKSKATNVVDQNTRAARTGEFKNILKEGIQEKTNDRSPATVVEASPSSRNTESAPSKAEPLIKNLFTLPQEALAPKEPSTGRKPASLPPHGKSGEGFSATNDYMPDVAIGANTLLNTQEFKYYSFYERIRQRLYYQWESRLKNEFDSLVHQGVTTISGDRITKLRVHLKRDGSIKQTDLVGTSGYTELDRAALEAFNAAAPFPNPPSGLIGSQDELSIDWSFVVVTAEDNGVHLAVRRNPYE